MRFFTLAISLCFALIANIHAEGTREVAPNGSITILGSPTNDIAALHINHPAYNNFASYSNSDPHSRLYINIKDPSKECLYVGFSFGHFNETSSNPTRKEYEYRIVDPAGNVVFGPITIPTTGGNIQNWSQGFTGPMQLHGAGGYNAHHVTALDLQSQGWTGEGNYYVEFEAIDGADFLVDYWDITVADCSAPTPLEKKGRVWSYNWSFFAINDFGFPNRPFNGAFYVCAPDPADSERAFITKIDFNGAGFRPAAFNVAFNSFGSMNTGNIDQDRKSVEGQNSTQSEYAIFLNDPVELCETAIVGEIELLGITRCNAQEYCIKFIASKEGQVDLLLDFDGPDDVFTPGSSDILITKDITAEEVGIPTCIQWDGLDGFGNPLPEVQGTTIPIILSYAQGIYHFPIYDAEFMTSGFMLEAVRPGGSIPLLHYDDSNISLLSGSGEPPVQISGCMVPCHTWTNFPNPNTPGFGNLNTINSWWFSQRILRQDVLFLPGYYTCSVQGPQSICQGGSTLVNLVPELIPQNVDAPAIISTIWNGPGIVGSNTGSSITVNAAGSYQVDVTWVTALGDTCSTACDYQLAVDPPLAQTIDTLIVQGQVLVINNEQYTEAGTYVQELTTTLGCDSILTINVLLIQSVLHYNLEACESFSTDNSPMDYSEFTPHYPDPLSCADITASIIFREPAQMQKHSCTEGVNNSVAMCVSSLDTCDYDPGNDASLIFEMTVTPDPDTAVHVTGFSFYERSPVVYNWLHGTSGPNNFPTFYGFRVLKNGIEIYRREDIPTTNEWTLQTFEFLDEAEFVIEDPALFRFELLPYCLAGNGAVVAAWDIDEVNVTASCAPFAGLNQIIWGIVRTPWDVPVNNAEITLSEKGELFSPRKAFTNTDGLYYFEEVPEGSVCTLRGTKNGSYVNGVSTLDLVQIQKHLLGHQPFDSPYKFVAADANRSQHVSAIDLVELRKLILGYYDELPNNTSWRLGNVHELNVGYKWGFKETIDIEQLNYDYPNANFTAVKIGDITGDANVNADGEIIKVRNSERVSLFYDDQIVKTGGTYRIDIKSDRSLDIAGLQLAMDLNGLDFVDIIGNAISIKLEDVLYYNSELRVSWVNTTDGTAKPGDVLFTIVVNAKRSGKLSQLMTISNNSLPAEMYLHDALETFSITIDAKSSEGAVQYNAIMQNIPNPFADLTTVNINMAEATTGKVIVADISGRILTVIEQPFVKGLNSVEITSGMLGDYKGVLICRIEASGWGENIRIVRF